MNRAIRLMASAFILSAALACNQNNDDDDSTPSNPQPERKSVVGASTKPGVFPDGTPAAALSEEQLKSVTTMAQGVVAVNQAVGTVTADRQKTVAPRALMSSSPVQVEAAVAALKNPLIQALIHNPKQIFSKVGVLSMNPPSDLERFKAEIMSKCLYRQSENQPVESGTENEKNISFNGWSVIEGAACPVASKADFSARALLQRLGEKSGRMTGAASLKYSNQIKSPEYQQLFDFNQESLQGQAEADLVILDQSMEAAANLMVDGQLITHTQGSVQAKVLADLYVAGAQEKLSSLQMSVVVTLKTPEVDVLLQIYAKNEGEQIKTQVFLNGTEIKPDLQASPVKE